jgi:glycerophosphoryl diester phosphodiesterase
MVVYPGGAGSGPECRRDLLVIAALLGTAEKHLALQPGEGRQAVPHPPFGFGRGELRMGIGAVRQVPVVEREHLASFPLAKLVTQEVAADGEEPAPERRLAPPAIEPPERPEKRVLDQVVHVAGGGAAGVQETADRPGVAADQLGGRALIAAPVGGHQCRIGRKLLGLTRGHPAMMDVGWTGPLSGTTLEAMQRPAVIAHRGASGYEYENSRAAFRRALMLDADAIELDVHATSDGGLVVHHDAEMPGFGPIAGLTRAQARQLRIGNGEILPLLEEVLELVGDMTVWVEIKTLPAEHDDGLLAILAAGPAPGRYAVHSFDHHIVRRLGEACPGLRRGILFTASADDPVAALRAVGATTLWQEAPQVNQALVSRVHDAGAELVAWTVDEIGEVDRLVRLGVDGLCGNYPDRIRVALAARDRSTTPA